MQLEVGLQSIDSNKNHIAFIEKTNAQLKLTLVLTVFFYKWKSKTALSTLAEERKIYELQRKVIYNELLSIRETVTKANKQEVSLLNNAVQKGSYCYLLLFLLVLWGDVFELRFDFNFNVWK